MNASRVGLAALSLLASADALACAPFAGVAAGYSNNYASVYWDPVPDHRTTEFPGMLGRVSAGVECRSLQIYIEHTSSLQTRMDRGYEGLFVEWRIGGRKD